MNNALLFSAGMLSAAVAAAQSSKPNIIVFVADDAGKDFGCYGNPHVQTPNIDRLAASGVRFDKAFVTCPQSSPSRIAMMTGLWAHTLGVEDLGTPIDDKTRMIPSYLREAGYYTGAMLKTHWGDNGNKQFDFYFNGRDPVYSEPYMTAGNQFFKKYTEFLDKKGNKPFFMWVGFIDPHRPYKEKQTVKVHDPKNVNVAPALVDAPGTRQDIADYYDEIHRLDQHVGFLIAELERRGERDNTAIIFLSDNGFPFVRGKAFLYDAGIGSPFIVSWKGNAPAGSVHGNGMVSFIDIAPTVLDIAGVARPEAMYGQSLVPLIKDPKQQGRTEIYAERNYHDTEDYARCIRTERYKLIFNAYPYTMTAITGDMNKAPSWRDLMDARREGQLTSLQSYVFAFPRPQIELYDLQADPGEFDNLADRGENIGLVRDLLGRVRKWQNDTGDKDWWEKEREDNLDRMNAMPIMPLKRRGAGDAAEKK